MTISRKTGVAAVAAAFSFGMILAMAPTEASAQHRGPGGYSGGHARGAHGGGYRAGYAGGYPGGYRGNRGGWGRGGAAAAGVIGGLALGALAAGAFAGPPAYAAPAYGAPVYGPGYGGYCEVRRERYWDGWAWRVQRVRVCN